MGRVVKKTKDLRRGDPSKPIGLNDRASSAWNGSKRASSEVLHGLD